MDWKLIFGTDREQFKKKQGQADQTSDQKKYRQGNKPKKQTEKTD